MAGSHCGVDLGDRFPERHCRGRVRAHCVGVAAGAHFVPLCGHSGPRMQMIFSLNCPEIFQRRL
jgi:hypothetical protein